MTESRHAEIDRVPDFLVVGAQKSGTTTLYEDLRCHPSICLADKESAVLLGSEHDHDRDQELPANQVRRRYARTLPPRIPGSVLGEVATAYTMLPEHPAVLANAVRGIPRAKIIYIVREPVSRLISHHHHDFGFGLTGPDINSAVHDHPALLDNSRYATQIEPWLDAYGRDAVLVLRFEDYIADRRRGVATIFDFLGLPPFRLPDPQAIYNAADDKRVGTGVLGRLARNDMYRKWIRPLVSEPLRRRLVRTLLPKAPPRPELPNPETVAFVVEQLWPEVERLADLLGTGPWWDRDDMLCRWLYQDGDQPQHRSDPR